MVGSGEFGIAGAKQAATRDPAGLGNLLPGLFPGRGRQGIEDIGFRLEVFLPDDIAEIGFAGHGANLGDPAGPEGRSALDYDQNQETDNHGQRDGQTAAGAPHGGLAVCQKRAGAAAAAAARAGLGRGNGRRAHN